MIEIEKRGLLTEDAYYQLRGRLQEEAVYLGADDKYVEYWIYPQKLLKLVKNLSKRNSVLSLKLNEIGVGNAYEEHELTISEDSFSTLEKIISHITKPEQIIRGTQKRENYSLDGVELALKWSEDWQYHIELECLVDDAGEGPAAIVRLDTLANKLGITLMTVAEEKEFIERVRAAKK